MFPSVWICRPGRPYSCCRCIKGSCPKVHHTAYRVCCNFLFCCRFVMYISRLYSIYVHITFIQYFNVFWPFPAVLSLSIKSRNIFILIFYFSRNMKFHLIWKICFSFRILYLKMKLKSNFRDILLQTFFSSWFFLSYLKREISIENEISDSDF